MIALEPRHKLLGKHMFCTCFWIWKSVVQILNTLIVEHHTGAFTVCVRILIADMKKEKGSGSGGGNNEGGGTGGGASGDGVPGGDGGNEPEPAAKAKAKAKAKNKGRGKK